MPSELTKQIKKNTQITSNSQQNLSLVIWSDVYALSLINKFYFKWSMRNCKSGFAAILENYAPSFTLDVSLYLKKTCD